MCTRSSLRHLRSGARHTNGTLRHAASAGMLGLRKMTADRGSVTHLPGGNSVHPGLGTSRLVGSFGRITGKPKIGPWGVKLELEHPSGAHTGSSVRFRSMKWRRFRYESASNNLSCNHVIPAVIRQLDLAAMLFQKAEYVIGPH